MREYGDRSSSVLSSHLKRPERPRIFVSYHHGADQWYYREFSRLFHDEYEAIEDRSLERAYDSDDADYVRWAIANEDIKGTSCTIVLCGAQTHRRKFVDWEIKATLDDLHGLVGVRLPNGLTDTLGRVVVPDRLHQNIERGYALWVDWTALTVQNVRAWMASARARSKALIVNPREIMPRNA